MRSSLFITLSVVFHVVCVTALAIGHFKKQQSGDFQVEAVAVDGGQNGSSKIETTIVEPDPVKVAPKTEAPAKPTIATVKTIKKPAQKPTQKPKVAEPITELPAKVVQPESLDPQIDDVETVAVVTPEQQPVQQAEAETSEKDVATEAVSQDVQESQQEQAPVTVTEEPVAEDSTQGQAEESATSQEGPAESAAQGSAGSSKAAAVSYLDLRQAAGNKGPTYPLKARVEKRQGLVGLMYKVTKEGFVQEIQVTQSSGHSDLDDAALKAIAKYRFVPGQEGWARHPVLFSLKGVQETMPSRLRSTGAQTE